MQPLIERRAAKLARKDEAAAKAFLTHTCVSSGEALARRWRQPAGQLFTRHIDGYVKEPDGAVKAPGYSKEWLRYAAERQGKQYTVEREFAPNR